MPAYPYPKEAVDTVKLGRDLTAKDFMTSAPIGPCGAPDIQGITAPRTTG